ncbi:phosphatidylinositol-glycan biosynthesis class W protein [Ambystoma mexicanum]|uniref:phosphatidylinositol-glycan biosynthesis class W protein n=1 Tax=Ambystoma mexicanum TaxID=8296 RepID=UPI0037E89770
MSGKLLKEAFVSNLNGTSLTEISLGLSVPPLCVVGRGLLLIFHHLQHGEPTWSWQYRLLLDFVLLVVPIILSCTLLSNVLFCVPLFFLAVYAITLCAFYIKRNNYVGVSIQEIIRVFLQTEPENDFVPSITIFRVAINILTAVSILAVDFPLFPRRYAKTESYGTGVMDFGVGCYVFANALVSPEARRHCGMLQKKGSPLTKQIVSVWPLLLLGIGRFLSVKAVDYHEHVSEYGVHWNFFFTLAVVRVGASVLLTIIPLHRSWIVAVVLAVLYQITLETTTLKMFILHGTDGKGTREGILNANREGLLSVFGYVAIYMAGMQVGLYVLKKRTVVKDWVKAIFFLLVASFTLFTMFNMLQEYIEHASRRIANLPFVVWVVAQCLFFLSTILFADLVLVFAKLLVNGSTVPCSWNCPKSLYRNKKIDDLDSSSKRKDIKRRTFCLLDAISRNQLLFFLLANVMTGLVNMLLDTIHTNNSLALSVLILYMFCNCIVMYVLHVQNIALKCW